ncbi:MULTISPECIES: FeoA domain-containing protein [unclassified Luteimonas]|uniref:FeoA family protein n=1 Tax=unclassified Luteimonas TaxID=2629088 RepID=UPI0018F0D153|nr:FeoA domain-containing protein [Luteimonas sp. MC1750]MBJ6979469.1 FeoA domain-containing protein [Luteimonas sp. MC1895]MBJ6984316.1 FeoA domain-containing protein [Luteimonas sp. MC1750]QQO05061.1 FeoA domain-containing protein [Luteimonas sp. MC1750]
MRLSELPRRVRGVVERVEARFENDPIARRLRELGFVAGEDVQVTAAGPFGAEPLLVQVGYTRFALRREEAARVLLAAVEDACGTGLAGESRAARARDAAA